MLLDADLDHTSPVPTPTAHHLVDMVGEHLLLLHLEITTDRVVVEGLGCS
jgi:hypothetical protein